MNRSRVQRGRLAVTARGFGFVTIEGWDADVFIPASEVGEARSGDLVDILVEQGARGWQGEVVRIVERPRRRIVARALPATAARVPVCRPYDAGLPSPLGLDNPGRLTVAPGDLLLVEIGGEPPRPGVRGKPLERARLVSVLGRDDDPRLDSRRVAVEFGLAGEFPPDVLEDERASLAGLPAAPVTGRDDDTAALVLTMDPETAHDFDDALAIDTLPDGRWRIHVHIADVAAFVAEGGAMDREARERSTSVYLPDGVVRMLPERMSWEGASLVPGAPRAVASVRFTLDAAGHRSAPAFGWSWIRNAARLSYERGQALLDGTATRAADEPAGLIEALAAMRAAAAVLRARRVARGAWDLDLPEIHVALTPDGRPVHAEPEVRLETHRIVEEMMLAANELVGAEMARRHMPLLYRIHPEPDPDKLQTAFRLARVLGVRLPVTGEGGAEERARRLLEQPLPEPQRSVLHNYVLRSLERARYSPDDTGHSGLGTAGYCHFTSPIRRYADLVNHRLLRAAVSGEVLTAEEREARMSWLRELGDHVSAREERAEQAERAATRLKVLRLLVDRLGDEVEATVVGLTPQAAFLELADPPVDGRLPREALWDDDYEMDAERFALIGRRSGGKIAVGARIRVRIARVTPETRELEFAPIEDPPRRRRGMGRPPARAPWHPRRRR